MVTIEDELRKVLAAYTSGTSGEESPVDRRASIECRVARHRRRRLIVGVIGLVVVIAGATTAGTLSGSRTPRPAVGPTHPAVVITPKITGPVRCDGSTAEPVLRDLFAALDAGRRVNVARYFVTPIAFNLWADPTLKTYITFMPGPGSGTVTLDALQAHLDKLRSSHLTITLTSFKADGFTDHDYDGGPPGGGFFVFTLRSGASRGSQGGGEGLVDCTTGKLKAIVIDQW